MTPGETFRFEVAQQDWRERTRVASTRLLELWQKREDSGLTADELREREQLKAQTGEELRRFLRESKA